MLRPRKHVKKREIKEDPFVTFIGRAQRLYRQYQKVISIVLTSIIGLIIIFVFMSRSKKSAELKASGKLGIAEQYYFSANFDRAVQELESVVKTYSGTKAAGRAAFYLANTYFTTEDYPNAEYYYRRAAKANKHDEVIHISSLMGIAACLESQRNYRDAAAAFESVSRKFPESFWAPFALKDAGRCYTLAEDVEIAKSMYRTIEERYPDASIAQEAAFLEKSL